MSSSSEGEKFWMYDVTQLFRSFELLPSPEDTLSVKLNTITRLALIICIVIAAYKPILAFSTMLLVMVVTMSVYSGAVADPTIEGFEEPYGDLSTSRFMNDSAAAAGYGSTNQLYEFMKEYNSTRFPDLNKVGFASTQKRFCNDAVPLEYGPDHVSPNQELVGGPNPKTKIPPLVVAPSHDLDSWRNNDFAVHSNINLETNFDAERSGYNCGILPTKCEECLYIPCQCKKNPPSSYMQAPKFLDESVVNGTPEIIEGFNGHVGARGLRRPGFGPHDGSFGGKRVGGYGRSGRGGRREDRGEADIVTNNPRSRQKIIRELVKEMGGNGKHNKFIRKYIRDVFLSRRLGDVEDMEIDEVIEDLTVPPQKGDDEVEIAPCFESPRRDNIITQTLQPGVFQKSHIGEPIQSNIGISYTQEWGPTEVQEEDGMIKYTMRDPKSVIMTPSVREEPIEQNNANVYDPRFTGYGTSYRSYVDKLTGRPKFFYDDIDAVTMPNYITRSKVDVFPWAEKYGPDKMMDESEYSEYRQLANNAFTDSALTFRTELQERLMRKRNAELWQRRVAPISTMGRLGSSMKSCL